MVREGRRHFEAGKEFFLHHPKEKAHICITKRRPMIFATRGVDHLPGWQGKKKPSLN